MALLRRELHQTMSRASAMLRRSFRKAVPDAEWDAAWTIEIEKRLEAAERRGERGASWAEARRRILARLSAM